MKFPMLLHVVTPSIFQEFHMSLMYVFAEMMNCVTPAALAPPKRRFYVIVLITTNGRRHNFSKYGLDFE